MPILLTHKFIRSLKPAAKKQTFTDSVTCNLRLVVHPSGRKVWSWQGRRDGKVVALTLGSYPRHDLYSARVWAGAINDARDAASELKRARSNPDIRASSLPPSLERIREQEAQPDPTRTCDWLFDLYMEHEGSSRKHARDKRQMYDRDIKPRIGHRLVDEITHQDLAEIIRSKSIQFPSASNHLHSLIRRWFRWAMTKGRVWAHLNENPAEYLVKLAPIATRSRYLNDAEIQILFEALERCKTPSNGVVIMALYLAARRGEIVGARWREFDLDEAVWSVEGDRTKNGLPFALGLPEEVVTLLREQAQNGGGRVFVWPGARSLREGNEERPLATFSNDIARLNACCRDIAGRQKLAMTSWCLHDLRRTVATGMHGLRGADHKPLIHPDIVERVLNHKIGGVRGIYNRFGYFADKARALRIWADHLKELRTRKPALASLSENGDEKA